MTDFGGRATSRTARRRANYPCNLNFRTDARAAWLADVGAAKIAEYDNVFYVSAGEDESATWQEFGEMKCKTQEDVTGRVRPQGLGDPTQTNWAITRYVPWSSWAPSRASGPTPRATRRSRPRPPAWRPTRTS